MSNETSRQPEEGGTSATATESAKMHSPSPSDGKENERTSALISGKPREEKTLGAGVSTEADDTARVKVPEPTTPPPDVASLQRRIAELEKSNARIEAAEIAVARERFIAGWGYEAAREFARHFLPQTRDEKKLAEAGAKMDRLLSGMIREGIKKGRFCVDATGNVQFRNLGPASADGGRTPDQIAILQSPDQTKSRRPLSLPGKNRLPFSD